MKSKSKSGAVTVDDFKRMVLKIAPEVVKDWVEDDYAIQEYVNDKLQTFIDSAIGVSYRGADFSVDRIDSKLWSLLRARAEDACQDAVKGLQVELTKTEKKALGKIYKSAFLDRMEQLTKSYARGEAERAFDRLSEQFENETGMFDLESE